MGLTIVVEVGTITGNSHRLLLGRTRRVWGLFRSYMGDAEWEDGMYNAIDLYSVRSALRWSWGWGGEML